MAPSRRAFAAITAGLLCTIVPGYSKLINKLNEDSTSKNKGADLADAGSSSNYNKDIIVDTATKDATAAGGDAGDIKVIAQEDAPKDKVKPGIPYCVIAFKELKEGLEDGSLTLIDVRNPEELYSMGRIAGSINVPLPEIPDAFLEEKAEEFCCKYGIPRPSPPGSELVVTCKTGKRAATAVDKLRPLGYTEIMLYPESFIGWAKNGGEYCKHGPVEEKEPPPAAS